MTHQQIEPVHLTIRDACAYSAYSRSKLYGAIAAGQIAAVKEGSRTLIVFDSLKKQIAARKPAAIGVGDPKFRALRSMGPVNTRRRRRKAK